MSLAHGHRSEWKRCFALAVHQVFLCTGFRTSTFYISLVLTLRSLHLRWGHCTAFKYSVLGAQFLISRGTNCTHSLRRQRAHLSSSSGVWSGPRSPKSRHCRTADASVFGFSAWAPKCGKSLPTLRVQSLEGLCFHRSYLVCVSTTAVLCDCSEAVTNTR